MWGIFLEHAPHGCTSLWTTVVLHWRKCNRYIVLQADETKTPISYARLASDFLRKVSRHQFGPVLPQQMSSVCSLYPECNLLFKTSYAYNKTPISHFCGDQLKQHKIQKVSNLRNIALMGTWLGPYKKYVNCKKHRMQEHETGVLLYLQIAVLFEESHQTIFDQIFVITSQNCLVRALYKNRLLLQKSHDCT
jgi:hypothetical protein